MVLSNLKLLEFRTLGQLRNKPTRLASTASPGLGLVVRVHVFGGDLAAPLTSSSAEARIGGESRDLLFYFPAFASTRFCDSFGEPRLESNEFFERHLAAHISIGIN